VPYAPAERGPIPQEFLAQGYDAVLLSLAAMRDAPLSQLIKHSRTVASIIPAIGFYLQPAVGGRMLDYEFWREFAGIPDVVAIKIAPFNRYQTIEVVRAVIDSGRNGDIALYTGNDDNIVCDLLTEFEITGKRAQIVGGLLGHWAVWTQGAVSLLGRVKKAGNTVPAELLTSAQQVTDMNAAIFDPQHKFHGCIPGINEVLRRQGLLEGRWCLNPEEDLSPGQSGEIDRVCKSYPHLCEADDQFIREHLDEWLR
jgi:hypothetical protein